MALIGGPDSSSGRGYIRLSDANSEENILRALQAVEILRAGVGAVEIDEERKVTHMLHAILADHVEGAITAMTPEEDASCR